MKVVATDLFKKNKVKLKEDMICHKQGDVIDLEDEERVNFLIEKGYVVKSEPKKRTTTRKKA